MVDEISYDVGVATHPGLCQISKETASAAPMLCTEYGPSGWMDGWRYLNYSRLQLCYAFSKIILSYMMSFSILLLFCMNIPIFLVCELGRFVKLTATKSDKGLETADDSHGEDRLVFNWNACTCSHLLKMTNV